MSFIFANPWTSLAVLVIVGFFLFLLAKIFFKFDFVLWLRTLTIPWGDLHQSRQNPTEDLLAAAARLTPKPSTQTIGPNILGYQKAFAPAFQPFDGFRPLTAALMQLWTEQIEPNVISEPRPLLEKDKLKMHFIPYCMSLAVVNGVLMVYLYQRTKQVGEQRLAGMKSIGIGGHCEAGNGVFNPRTGRYEAMDSILATLSIEYHEEITTGNYADHISLDSPFEVEMFEHVGFVSATDEVGQVHLGLAFTNIVDPTAVDHYKVAEAELIDLGFHSLEALEAIREELEPWSQNCLDWLLQNQGAVTVSAYLAYGYEPGEEVAA